MYGEINPLSVPVSGVTFAATTATVAGVTTVAGVAVLPDTGTRNVIFAIALAIFSIGVVVLIASTVVAAKQRTAKAKV